MTEQYINKTSLPPAVASADLPSASSPDLILVPAHPLEYVHTWYLNAGEWRGPLTMEQYLDREESLKKQDLTKDGHLTAWILTSTALPKNMDGSRPILAACESMLKHAYIARDGQLHKVLAHGVASVYTRPEYRGKGYAGRMMSELGKALRSWQHDPREEHFSVLFSDIGSQYYPRFGWKVFPSTHILLKPLSIAISKKIKAALSLPEVEDIRAKDLPSLPTVSHVEHELRSKSKANPAVSHLAIRPDLEHLGWHHAREDVQCRILGDPYPAIKGAISTPRGLALIWNRVFSNNPQENHLVVLKTVIPAALKTEPDSVVEKTLAALLLRAQEEAAAWNMHMGVEIWSPDKYVMGAANLLEQTQGAKQVELITRDKEHVCCLRWDEKEDEEVVWVANESSSLAPPSTILFRLVNPPLYLDAKTDDISLKSTIFSPLMKVTIRLAPLISRLKPQLQPNLTKSTRHHYSTFSENMSTNGSITNWVAPNDKTGEFKRQQSSFRNWISTDAGTEFAPEKDRYHLYVSYACPWAHRILIVRKLKGLEDIIPFTSVHWEMLEKGWRFAKESEGVPGENVTPDPLHPEFTHLREIYFSVDPEYQGRFTVPTLYDKKNKTIVNNESSEILRMFYTCFDTLVSPQYADLDLFPKNLQSQIEETNEWTYNDINNGVYKSGFATTQEAYEKAVIQLFKSLDRAEEHLKTQHGKGDGPYYYGKSITEADIRLYTTIIRFDVVYVQHFKTNIHTIRAGYPYLHAWVRNLYWNVPAFGETTQFEHIKKHYTKSHKQINKFSITPVGPVPDILGVGEEVAAVRGVGK